MAKPRASTKREAPLRKTPDIDLPEDVKKEGRRKRDKLVQFFSPFPPKHKPGDPLIGVPPNPSAAGGARRFASSGKFLLNSLKREIQKFSAGGFRAPTNFSARVRQLSPGATESLKKSATSGFKKLIDSVRSGGGKGNVTSIKKGKP